MNKWYLLKHRKPVPYDCDVFTDPERFEKLSRKHFSGHNRRIRKNYINDVCVSTVFLGLDHSFEEGAPILFETLVFGGENDGDMYRCSTHREALKQHWMAVRIAKKDD